MNASPQPNPTKAVTRGIAILLVPLLLAAGVILYIWPDRTAELFAWTITPRLTPLLMGAGYLAGAYFFVRVAAGEQRGSVVAGFPPIAVFAWILAGTTLMHWDRFNHSHVTFITWVIVYALTPLILPALWLLNRTSTRQPAPHDRSNGPAKWIMVVIGATGALLVAIGVVLFVTPERLIPLWPWTLTPLTARVVASWFILAGLQDIGIATQQRWEAARVILQTQLIGLALIILGIPRALDVMNWNNILSGIFVLGFGILFLGLLAVYVLTERQTPTAAKMHPV